VQRRGEEYSAARRQHVEKEEEDAVVKPTKNMKPLKMLKFYYILISNNF